MISMVIILVQYIIMKLLKTLVTAQKKIDVGTVNTDYPAATAITNREYEESVQNDRRRIKLLDPRFIDDFVEEFKTLIKERVI